MLVPVGTSGSTIALQQTYTQNHHVQLPYSHSLAAAEEAGNYGTPTPIDLGHLGYPPLFVKNFESVPGTDNTLLNLANPAPQVDQLGLWAIDPHGEGITAPNMGEVNNVGGPPVNYGPGCSVPYTRRTKTGRRASIGGPPQAFEGHIDVLATRLTNEGADPDAVDLIRHVIFVAEVTEAALTAPVKSRQLSLKCGGVRKKWQLLLQEIEVVLGAKRYCCRLCPQEQRTEYRSNADGLRHLKRDHFGISIACKYW